MTYHSVVADFKRANTRLDIVVRVGIIEVLNQLAVDLAHGMLLGDLVEDDVSVGDARFDGISGCNY